ncbi:serine hydrolase [Thalassobacillus hwangdonensis]|uniref:Serine hydrolase n=1 Tax=Thalassobacillus hwangdonensis TaxID=546108 RepID=A0ABW3L375_9BACI
MERQLQHVLDRIEGEVAILVSIESKRYEHNVTQKFSAASLIKWPIFLYGFHLVSCCDRQLDEPIPMFRSDVVGGAGVIQSLPPRPTYSFQELLTLMMVVSDNTATNILIRDLGIENVQAFIKENDLQGTHLNRNLMDMDAMEAGLDNTITAAAIGKCLSLISDPDLFEQKYSTMMMEILSHQQFTDKLSAKVNVEEVQFYNKTGELPGVEHDSALIKYKANVAEVVVLTEGLTSNWKGKELIADVGKLVVEELIVREEKPVEANHQRN